MKYKTLGGVLRAISNEHSEDSEYRILYTALRVNVGVFVHNVPKVIYGWDRDSGEVSRWVGDMTGGWSVLKRSALQD